MNADILIQNGLLLPLTDEYPGFLQSGFIKIRNSMITDIGPMADIGDHAAGLTIDAAGSLVMPGLVNTHTHAAMTLFRGLADDLPLMSWLNDHIFPAEARFVNEEMVYWCTKLAAAEMIRSGTTTVADGYFHEDAAARAFMECGMRAMPAQGVIDFPAPGVPDPAKNVETAARFIDSWTDRSGLIRPAVFCHSAYTCSPATLRKTKKMAGERGVPFFIHVAETKAEVQQIRDLYNTTPVRHLEALGILDKDTVCVHCIWLDAEERGILADRGAKVITCPASNMKLASGIAPVPEMLAADMVVSLGTDGAASNNRLDMFHEMDLLAKLHKISRLDPTAVPARQALTMATMDGARALGLDTEIGSLAIGKKTDLILIDIRQPHLQPVYSPDILVYCARGADVHTVIINGKVVMENRELLTIDEEMVMNKVIEMI